MTPPLSIVIASHNDPEQTVLTLASIRETSPPEVEIVIVDDCSATPLHHYVKPDEHTKLVTNAMRCGCGPSRHIGAMHATADRILICDSHMRFTEDWYERWQYCGMGISPEEFARTVYCATCIGLDSKHMDVNNPAAEYHGAGWNFFGPDRIHPKNPPQVFECVWLPNEPDVQDGHEISAMMGAGYFINREWFFHLSCLRYLSPWGCDEQALSLASWLAGGSVRMARSVRIAHKFLIAGKEKQVWGCPPGRIVFNKMLVINSMLPEFTARKLTDLLLANTDQREAEVAKRLYRDEFFLVACEKARYQHLFTRSFGWFCDKFSIPMP